MSRAVFEHMRRGLEQIIAQRGWAVLSVGGANGEPDDLRTTWSYTIGLCRLHLPELIICGLPPKLCQKVLNDAGDRMKAGEPFMAGTMVDELINHPMAVRTVHRSWYESTMGWVYNIERRWSFDALQLVYPDRDGRYPGDEGVPPEFLIAQPRLDVPHGLARTA